MNQDIKTLSQLSLGQSSWPILAFLVLTSIAHLSFITVEDRVAEHCDENIEELDAKKPCLLYTSPSPRDRQKSRMPSSA